MSVHGEYSRHLERTLTVLETLRGTQPRPDLASAADQLRTARLSAEPDLSRAAESALAALALIPEGELASRDLLADARDALAAHCRVILGRP